MEVTIFLAIISIIIALIAFLVPQIIRYVNRPQLILDGNPRTQEFRPSPIEHGTYSRFILIRIRNRGGRTAQRCTSILRIEGRENEFRMHWAGESWEYHRDAAPTVDIVNTEPRELDIAFSICGHKTTPPYQGGIPSTIPPIHYDSSTGRPGAWLATPFVTENYEEDSPAYIEPGRHRVEIRIIPSEGHVLVYNFVIVSTEDPSELHVDNDTIEYGAIN